MRQSAHSAARRLVTPLRSSSLPSCQAAHSLQVLLTITSRSDVYSTAENHSKKTTHNSRLSCNGFCRNSCLLLQERYRGKHRKLWWAFVDLEKAFDRVPRKVVEWAMRKLGVEEWLVRAVMATCKHARTRVRSYDGSVSEWFGVNVGVHQGSVLSPLLFIIVMEAVTHSVREGLPWEMLYADDMVLVGKYEEELKEKMRK